MSMGRRAAWKLYTVVFGLGIALPVLDCGPFGGGIWGFIGISVLVVALIGLTGYAWNRSFFIRKIWIGLFWAEAVVVVGTIALFLFLGVGAYLPGGRVSESSYWQLYWASALGIMFGPMLVAHYRYAFRSQELWGPDA